MRPNPMRPDPMRLAAAVAVAVLLAAGCGDGGGTSSGSDPAPSDPAPSDPAPSDPSPPEEVAAGDDTVALAQADAGPDCPTEGEEIDTTKLYIEHNATDADTGVHGMFGGEAWRQLCLWDPAGNLVLSVDPLAQLDDLGLADFFFESREPLNTELSIDDLLLAFPEGDYTVGAVDFEGVARTGVAVFTHDIPVEPVITSPELIDEPEATDAVLVPTAGLVVAWEPVTETLAGDTPTITAYELIVTNEDVEHPDSRSQPIYDVIVPASVTALAVPEEFLEPGTVYELEVLALEESGNQTIGLGFFATE